MKSRAFTYFNYFFFFGLGIVLLYFALRKQDLNLLFKEVRQASPWVFFLVFSVTFFGNLIRALRWRLLIEPLGYKPAIKNTFLSLMLGYFINFAIPRLGEVSRCLALNKTEGVPFNSSLGTVITERAFDIFILFLICIVTFIIQHDLLAVFLNENIIAPVSHLIKGKLTASFLMLILFITLAGLAALALAYFFRTKINENKAGSRILFFIRNLWTGIISVFRMKSKGRFLLYTLLIWVCYFLSTYLWFFGYEKTQHLGLSAGLTLLVVGSLGRSLPIQGQGLGAYHFLVAQALILYGILPIYGNALAMIIYVTQTCFYLFAGALCSFILIFSSDYKKKSVSVTS